MRSIIIICCLVLSRLFATAQQNYDAGLIPKELLPYASAVVRDKQETVDVRDFDDVIDHVKEVITVLNDNGDRYAHMVVYHDKAHVIKSIKGVAYNEFGKPIKKFSESDFEDVSAANDFSLFEDARVKHYLPSITTYPYTIAYEYEVRLKESLNFPRWQPTAYFGVAVEKSSYTFICKPDFKIKYKETNLQSGVKIATDPKGLKTYSWQANNLKAVKNEPLSPYPANYLGSVQIAPEKFSYYGYEGTFDNWHDLGKWEYDKLVSDRQGLPMETVAHVREITKDIADPKLKARKIYEYMQGKTHYISVQVGIGGYQPFLASDVDKQNYGDCKALVNYTQALLKAVNIDSWYCIVESGREYKVGMIPDFASMQGNHAILCVPFKNDTTWADCTSQSIPFGYLGSFTDDRTVLACTPEGGKLLHTPKYTADENIEKRKADFVINEAGELTGNMETIFKGADYEEREREVGEAPADRVKNIKRIYPINNLEIEKLQYHQDKSFNPFTREDIKLSARDYAALTDGKFYFMINSVDREDGTPPQVRNRTNSVYINRGHTEEDEITYTLPAGYHLEKEPLNVSVKKPFGEFSVNMKVDGNKVTYKRNFKIIDGTFSKDTYGDVVDFYQLVYDADHYTVSLAKN